MPQWFQAFVAHAPNEIYILDERTHHILLASEGACANLGYTKLELLAMRAEDICGEAAPIALSTVLAPLLSETLPCVVSASRLRRKDGTHYFTETHSYLCTFARKRAVLQLVHDVTERNTRQLRDALLHAVERDAAEAGGSMAFLHRLMERLGAYFDRPIAHLSIWSERDACMQSSGLWRVAEGGALHADFKTQWHKRAFAPGEGLSGRSRQSGASVDLARLEDAFDPATCALLRAAGVRTAMCVPVSVNGAVHAVIELFSPNIPQLHNGPRAGFDQLVRSQISRLYEAALSTEALFDSNERFDTAIRGADVGFWDYNFRSDNFFVSPRCIEILGDRPPTWDAYGARVHSDDVAHVREAVRSHIIRRNPYDAEYRVRGADGDYVWVHVRSQGVWDDYGAIVRTAGTIEDVTPRKQAELLRREIMTIMAGGGDTDSKLARVLETAAGYFGADRGAVSRITGSEYEILHQFARAGLDAAPVLQPLAQSPCALVFPTDNVHAYLSLPPASSFGGAIQSYIGATIFARGTRFGTICFWSSVTRLKAYTEAEIAIMRLLALWVGDEIARASELEVLLDNDRQKSASLAAVGDAVLTVNTQGRIESANAAACDLFLMGDRQLGATSIQRLLVGARAPLLAAGRLAPILDHQDVITRSTGQRVAVLVNVREIRLSDRIVYTVTLADLTAVKQAETAKREFVSIVSHELRTPLTSIRGALGLIAAQTTGPLTAATANLIHIAQRNSDRLARLVNDILDIEKLESGRLDLDLQSLDIVAALRDAVAANAAYAARFGVTYRLHAEQNMPLAVADNDRLSQVIANLLSNAAKFTAPNTDVSISARERDGRIRVEVADKGAGVPAHLQSRIFDKFTQGDGSNTREREGSGLGLSIARQLMLLMGGEIGFDSREGQGATFYITLPSATVRPRMTTPEVTHAA